MWEHEVDKNRERIVETRIVVYSGHPPSARVTIPPLVLKKLDLKEGDRLAFIMANKLVIIENPRTLLPKVLEDEPVLFALKLIGDITEIDRQLSELVKKYSRGEIEELEWRKESGELTKQMREKYRVFKEVKARVPMQAFGERELHFISLDELDQLLATISIDEEREKEEDFLALLEDVKKFKEELDSFRDILKQLERGFTEGRISKKQYEMLRERDLGRLTFAEDRLNRLKKLVCSP